jgi:hypothetical protein
MLRIMRGMLLFVRRILRFGYERRPLNEKTATPIRSEVAVFSFWGRKITKPIATLLLAPIAPLSDVERSLNSECLPESGEGVGLLEGELPDPS